MSNKEPGKELSSELGKLRYRTHHGGGMTQEQVADLINVSTISLRAWESGRFRPSVPNLQKLLEVYAQEGAFSPGKEQEEIRGVWEKAQQAGLKAALDEEWFTELQKKSLSPASKPHDLPTLAENAKAPTTGANVRIDAPSLNGAGEPTSSTNVRIDAPPISADEPFSQRNTTASRLDELLESFLHLSEKQQDRLRMLDKVHRIWIKGLLEKSLQNDAEIELALCEQPDVVETSWKHYLQTVPHPLEESPSSFHIFDAYENAQGKLLILGEPGSGKTTLLLQLTRILLANARHDISFPIPVIVSLSSWTEKRLPIAKWLVAELRTKYHIPLALSQQWMDQNQLLPLFDGLDEVDTSYYSACIEELNIYLKEHGLVPTVICSRSSEYLNQPTRLLLQNAVLVQPLTEQQIEVYLSNTQGQHKGIQDIFSANSELQGLARTPLMLRILTTTYENGTVVATNTGNGLDIQQQALATYILQMFKRRAPDVRYDPQQTIHYLQWLAQQLRRYNQSAFYIEFMQFDWLPAHSGRQLYPALAVALAYGLLSALGFGISYLPYFSFQQVVIFFLSLAAFNTFLYSSFNGIIFGILADDHTVETQTSLEQRSHGGLKQKIIAILGNRVVYGILNGLLDGIFVAVLVGPVSGWICGLFSGLFCAAMGKLDTEIKSAAFFEWSLPSMVRNAYKFLAGGLLVGLLYGLVTGRDFLFTPTKLFPSLILGLAIGLLVGLIMSIRGGFIQKIPNTDKILKPNQGIQNSIRNSLFFGSFFGIAFGLLFSLIYGPVLFLILGDIYRSSFPPNSGLIYGISDGVLVAAFFWLVSGGIACIQHTLLRLMLWTHGCIPWNYAHFLDRAVDLALLYRLGGGYIFFHRLLQEYFETLDDTQIQTLLNRLNKP